MTNTMMMMMFLKLVRIDCKFPKESVSDKDRDLLKVSLKGIRMQEYGKYSLVKEHSLYT